jgi:hypothetical protein
MQFTRVRLNLRYPASLAGIAACLLMAATCAQAHTFCVASSAAIQAAFTAASDGGANDNEDNTIQIVIGTHSTADNGNAEFYYNNQTTTRKLDVNGGYNSDCSINTENPVLTVLDGGGATRVFESESVSGDVSVRYLTFQNGSVGAGQIGAGVLINGNESSYGPVIFDQNIVRNNHTAYYGGGFFLSVNFSSTLQFENNLIVGNSADGGNGGGEIIDNGSGANLINNTFAQNTVTTAPASQIGGLYFVTGSTVSPPPDTMTNNIFWANSGYDLGSTGVLVRNDFTSNQQTMDPTSSGNLTIDPRFSGSTDFHLLPTSPLLGQGLLMPTGNLPTIDIEGHPRSYNGLVDMGAYERGDEIFKDGYEG